MEWFSVPSRDSFVDFGAGNWLTPFTVMAEGEDHQCQREEPRLYITRLDLALSMEEMTTGRLSEDHLTDFVIRTDLDHLACGRDKHLCSWQLATSRVFGVWILSVCTRCWLRPGSVNTVMMGKVALSSAAVTAILVPDSGWASQARPCSSTIPNRSECFNSSSLENR